MCCMIIEKAFYWGMMKRVEVFNLCAERTKMYIFIWYMYAIFWINLCSWSFRTNHGSFVNYSDPLLSLSLKQGGTLTTSCHHGFSKSVRNYISNKQLDIQYIMVFEISMWLWLYSTKLQTIWQVNTFLVSVFFIIIIKHRVALFHPLHMHLIKIFFINEKHTMYWIQA